MSGDLSVPKFQLDVFKAVAEAQVNLMKAYADFNFRMMEVLEKRVKIEGDVVKVKAMKRALKEYERALQEVKAEQNRLNKELERVEKNVGYVGNAERGEDLPADLVSYVWIGFRYFISNNRSTEVSTKLAAITVDSEARRGMHYSHNRTPQEQCEDAPGDIGHVRRLLEWLAKKSYMPRIGSPPYDLVARVVSIFRTDAQTRQAELEQRLVATHDELNELRAASFESINIGSPPKKPEGG